MSFERRIEPAAAGVVDESTRPPQMDPAPPPGSAALTAAELASTIRAASSFAAWRDAAREGLRRALGPESVGWASAASDQQELFAPPDALNPSPDLPAPAPVDVVSAHVPREFLSLAEEVACHRDPERWLLLYRIVWRLTRGRPGLLADATDADVYAAHRLAHAVQRDLHRMRAYVRFREIATSDGPWFVAWYEPEHDIVEANGAFFRDRFAAMRWSILTPERCAHWDRRELTFTPGVAREAAPTHDAAEDLWRTYYASTFNPARVNPTGLQHHLPRQFWKNLPEATIIPSLIAEAQPRSLAMVNRSQADVAAQTHFGVPAIPPDADLAQLRRAAAGCRACPLWRQATCTVFGTGPEQARVVVVGEQPGDQEDRRGQPFIGPAGQLLDRAFAAAGIHRSQLYLTNAVKHFKWEPRGKRRLHKTPGAREIAACRPWLEAELARIRPQLIVCLGATAAQAVLRRPVRVRSERGTTLATQFGAPTLITVHPSALLRLPEGADPAAEFAAFVADLRQVHAYAGQTRPAADTRAT